VVTERHHEEREEMERWTEEERHWWSLGPFAGEIPGLVRRVRRILDVSQRGLATLLGVSQSVVARWETGRTSPRASVLQRLLAMAGVEVAFHDRESGEPVEPMRDDGARTRGGSRFPAHADLKAKGWWIPRHLRTWTTNDAYRWQKRSRLAEQPSIGYRASRYWKRLEREVWGTPIDHPAHHQVVAELHARDEQREARRTRAA
jgi:HTH-type transcriptional regulator/antitoxin HipB